MSTHNIHFHDKIKKNITKISLNVCFLSYRPNFIRTKKRIRIRDGKRAIGVRDIKVLLYAPMYAIKTLLKGERQIEKQN